MARNQVPGASESFIEPLAEQVYSRDKSVSFIKDIKPILDNRCVACHACYDAPCQLKTTAPEGLERGASKQPVYHSTRLTPADPSRLFVDSQTTAGWRDKGFFDVLDKPDEGRVEPGLIRHFLDLKEQHPFPESGALSDEYMVGLDRSNE